MRDLGVKQAPFVVLIGAQMPSVLAEISFVTNRSDASALKQSATKQRIAQSLFDAIVGAFGLTGALVRAAVISGAMLAAVWIVMRQRRRTYESDAPPSLGSAPLGPGSTPSDDGQ